MDNKALGKGLSALIPEKKIDKDKQTVMFVKTKKVNDNSYQPRINYDDARLEELKMSIQEKGVLQPILVRNKDDSFEVVAGERRLKAARAIGLEEIPVIVKDVSDQEALVIALVENIQREELNPIEEAEAFKRLIEQFGYSQEEVAHSVGKDRSTISNIIRLLKLPKTIQQGLSKNEISMGHARALLAMKEDLQLKAFEIIKGNGLSVRAVETLVKKGSKLTQERTKQQKPKNSQLAALEDGLQKLFGTKVEVLAKKKKGKIVIEYYSYEDLERIINIMKKK